MIKTHGLSHIALSVLDPDRALEFYRSIEDALPDLVLDSSRICAELGFRETAPGAALASLAGQLGWQSERA